MTENKEFASLFTGIEEAKDKELCSGLKPENRPRGILSKAEREYLCGLKDYAHAQYEAKSKQDIRDRI